MSTQQLQAQLSGSLLLPSSAGYEEIRRGWNRAIDHRPALILIPHTAQDIVLGLRYAREVGLGVAVQLTGHGIQQPADGGLLIVTREMTEVQIDAEARTARIGSGVVWQHVLDQATPHGLAALLGTSSHVGVIGYTLGGGLSWLGRRYGFAADRVRWIELVTADGQLLRASPTENRELFWGLRGGGGNFGVVTAMEFELFPVATLYGGTLTYPGALAGEALRFFRDWTKDLPDEITSSITILRYPALPQLPEELRGQVFVNVQAACVGDTAVGLALIQPWLDWRTPLENSMREMPFAEIGTISNDPIDPRAAHVSSEMFDVLGDTAIDTIVSYTSSNASPLFFSELRHLGGAIARGDPSSSAVGNRDAQFYLRIGAPTPTPQVRAAVEAYIAHYKRELQPDLRGSVYLNFMIGSEARQRAQDAYPPSSYQRLRELKAKYDPENMFRYSYQLVEQELAEA
jgi:FAD/FMN-containing dehydrogenase